MTPQTRWLQGARQEVTASGPSFCLVLLALLITGCGALTRSPGGASTAPTPAQGSQVDHAVSPVVLRDPASSTLDISMSVTFDQQTGDPQSWTEVGLSFSSGGHPIQFAGTERVTCGSTDLSLKDRVAVFQVLRAPAVQVAGTTVRCNYAANGVVATVWLQIPAAPAITSPQMGAQVVRSAQMLVTYRCDPVTCTMFGIVALAPLSPSPKTIAKLNTPGPQQATVDSSGFAPGSGSLVLTASLTPHMTETGAPFKSISASGTATTPIAVTWI